MNRLRWLGIQLVDRIGIPGTLTLVILCVTAVYYLHAVRPLERQLMEVGTTVVLTPDKARQAQDPAAQLDKFRAFFQQQNLERQLQVLHEAGTGAGVAVKRIEYRMLDDRRARLRQYQIVIPVASSYPSIRRFVSMALAKLPALSLDHIAFQRKRISDTAIDAELRFTLFFADPV